MIDKLKTTGKLLYGLYPLAVHPEDFQPWLKVNSHWLSFSIFDMHYHIKSNQIDEWEFTNILAYEYDEETAKEALVIAKWFNKNK